MTSKRSGVPPVLPKTQRVADGLREREAEQARVEAEAAAVRVEAEAEAAGMDLVAYLRRTGKEKITFNLSADICEAIRDHARPLRMSHSEIVERGVRMFFRSELISVPGPVED